MLTSGISRTTRCGVLLAGLIVAFFACADRLQAQNELFDVAIETQPGTPYYDGVGRAIHQNRDGTIVSVSATQGSNMTQFNMLDPLGGVIFQRYIWEDPGLDPWSIHQDAIGGDGYVLVGAAINGGRRAVIVKLAADAQPLWYHRLGTGNTSEYRCVEVLANGDYVAVGTEEDNTTTKTHAILSCFSPVGVHKWTKRINYPNWNLCAHIQFRGFALRQTADGNLVVVGHANFDCSGFGTPGSVMMCKVGLSPTVTVLWSQMYSADGYTPSAYDVRETCDNGFLLTGVSHFDPGSPQDVFVLRTDDVGNHVWSTFAGSSVGNDQAFAVEETARFGAMIVGGSNSFAGGADRIMAARFSAAGVLEWSGIWTNSLAGSGNSQYAYDMERSQSGTYLVAAYTDQLNVSPTDPQTYVLNIDNELCLNRRMCNFSEVELGTSGVLTPQGLSIAALDGPDSLAFAYYQKAEFFYQEVRSCPPNVKHPPLFQFHYDFHQDRGYAGITEKVLVSGGQEERHVLTGRIADNLGTNDVPPDYRLPFIRIKNDGQPTLRAHVDFEKSPTEVYGAEARDIKHKDDGNYVIVGRLINQANQTQTEDNALLFTADQNANQLFAKSFGTRTAKADEMFFEVQPVPTLAAIDGNGFVAAGYAENNILNKQAMVVHVDLSGNVNWAYTYKIDNRQHSVARSIYNVDSDGDGLADNGFIVAGYSYNATAVNGFADNDVWVMRLDASGGVMWSYSYSAGDCQAFGIVQTDDDSDGVTDDGFILSGVEIGSNGHNNLLVIKLSSAGVVQWSKVYNRSDNDQGTAILQQNSGEFALTGVTVKSGFEEQAYIVKLDANGNINSSHCGPDILPGDDGNPNREDCANDIYNVGDGSLLIVGSTCSYPAVAGVKGDIYAVRTYCEADCRMQNLQDEFDVPHTMNDFDNTLNTSRTDINNSDWVHTEDSETKIFQGKYGIICLTDELPCEPPISTVSSATDFEAVEIPQLTVRPNPLESNAELQVEFPEQVQRNSTLQVFDLRGRQVFRANIAAGSTEYIIPATDWPAGSYTIVLKLEQATVARAGLIVR